MVDLNTALETLMEGKPMIVIPKSFDQPAVAARLEWLKVAEVLSTDRLSVKQIRVTLAKMLTDPSYRQAAESVKSRFKLPAVWSALRISSRSFWGGILPPKARHRSQANLLPVSPRQ